MLRRSLRTLPPQPGALTPHEELDVTNGRGAPRTARATPEEPRQQEREHEHEDDDTGSDRGDHRNEDPRRATLLGGAAANGRVCGVTTGIGRLRIRRG